MNATTTRSELVDRVLRVEEIATQALKDWHANDWYSDHYPQWAEDILCITKG